MIVGSQCSYCRIPQLSINFFFMVNDLATSFLCHRIHPNSSQNECHDAKLVEGGSIYDETQSSPVEVPCVDQMFATHDNVRAACTHYVGSIKFNVYMASTKVVAGIFGSKENILL